MSEKLGPFARIAARLLERGYSPIPIIPGTKRPGYLRGGEYVGMVNWSGHCDHPISRLQLITYEGTDAGVGIALGYHDVVVADIDTRNRELLKQLKGLFPPTPVRKVGAKGETLFYRCSGLVNRSFSVAGEKIVELLGRGRQTVLPPSVHPDTHQPYRNTGLEALEDIDPEDLPELPADIAEHIAALLAPLGGQEIGEEREPRQLGDPDAPHRQLNEEALRKLSAWVPELNLHKCRRKINGGFEAVATWRASTTGRPLTERARNLKIDPTGIKDFGTDLGYTPIDLVMVAQGYDLETAFGYLAGHIGWVENPLSEELIERAESVQTIGVKPEKINGPGGIELDGIRTEREYETKVGIVSDAPGETEDKSEGVISDDVFEPLTHVPGVVGNLIDWITDTARRPNRVLALGAAITIVGTLIGRRAAGPTRSATHLYAVILAPTTSGKDHGRQCIAEALTAAGAEEHIGPSKFSSNTAVVSLLKRKPLSLCTIDEFGAFMGRINHYKAQPYERGISEILRTLWGSSFGTETTGEWAKEASALIRVPALSIYGLSVPEEFYGGLTSGDLTGGFLNRLLVFSSNRTSPDGDPKLPSREVPATLTAALKTLYQWIGSPIQPCQLAIASLKIDPEIIPWHSQEAKDCYDQFNRSIEARLKISEQNNEFFGRSAEIAIRLATIRAAGRWVRDAAIDLSDMQWGRDLALQSAMQLAREARLYMAENERQRHSLKILRFISRRQGVTRRDIQQHLKGAIKGAELTDMIKNLVEAGEVRQDGSQFKKP